MMIQRALQFMVRNKDWKYYGIVSSIHISEVWAKGLSTAGAHPTSICSSHIQSRAFHVGRSKNAGSVIQPQSSLPTYTYIDSCRAFSSSGPLAPSQSPLAQGSPPTKLTEEMALGVQDATQLFIKHGLGRQALNRLGQRATPEGDTSTLVARWQEMLQAYLGCQLHVLGGLGYPADERGIATYNAQLSSLMSMADPTTQETLRVSSRDTWRTVITLAFNLSQHELEGDRELSIADARDIMYKISQKIMSPPVLEKLSKEVSNLETGQMTKQEEIAQKHTVVQQVLITEVYCGQAEGSKSMVEEAGFGEGERGYIKLQSAMAEYQSDPLVAQYMGGAMMHVLRAAGLEEATREMAESMQNQK